MKSAVPRDSCTLYHRLGVRISSLEILHANCLFERADEASYHGSRNNTRIQLAQPIEPLLGDQIS